MSVIVYNGIQLPYANTTQFLQRANYEESNTDRILTEFDVSIQCLISSTYAALLNPRLGNVTTNPADFMAWVRQRLLQQRQKLSIKVNGTELIPTAQTGNLGSIDAMNGPLPQHCEITQLTDTLFMMNYRIIAKYWENNNGDLPSVPVAGTNNPGGDILYNRWSETITIDENNHTTRTRRGKFMIRSDNKDGFIADKLRSAFAVVGVPVGFLRTRNEYTIDPSGLIMTYLQEDKEQYKIPPNPAFTAEGHMTLETAIGASFTATTHVKLTGSGNPTFDQTNQITLMYTALYIATQKIVNYAGHFIPPLQSVPQHVSVSLDLFRNEVTADCRILLTKQTGRVNVLLTTDHLPASVAASIAINGINGNPANIDTNFIDMFYGLDNFTPISDDQSTYEPAYLAYGTAGLLLNAAAYYDPSITNAFLAQPPNPGGAQLITTIPQQPGPSPANMAVTNAGLIQFLPQPGTTGKNG
jgi:hypothetical protein